MRGVDDNLRDVLGGCFCGCFCGPRSFTSFALRLKGLLDALADVDLAGVKVFKELLKVSLVDS